MDVEEITSPAVDITYTSNGVETSRQQTQTYELSR